MARAPGVLVDCSLARLADLASRRSTERCESCGHRDYGGPRGPGQGPLVEVAGLTGVAMSDVVELGDRGLPGEAVAIRGDVTTVQAYEYTGGLAPGQPARSQGAPLSARLGPHLLGGVFYGLLRPLTGAPAGLEPARSRESATGRKCSSPPRLRWARLSATAPAWDRWPWRAGSGTGSWRRPG